MEIEGIVAELRREKRPSRGRDLFAPRDQRTSSPRATARQKRSREGRARERLDRRQPQADLRNEASGAGYVTRFPGIAILFGSLPGSNRGSALHKEYWIPADDLPEFNDNIVGYIEIIAEFSRAKSLSIERLFSAERYHQPSPVTLLYVK